MHIPVTIVFLDRQAVIHSRRVEGVNRERESGKKEVAEMLIHRFRSRDPTKSRRYFGGSFANKKEFKNSKEE